MNSSIVGGSGARNFECIKVKSEKKMGEKGDKIHCINIKIWQPWFEMTRIS